MSVHIHKFKANALWQKDKLQRRNVFRATFNTINMAIYKMRHHNIKIMQQNVK